MIPILQFNELSPEDILNRDIRQETGVDEAVDAVLAAVRERGDDALRDYTRRFDGAELQELQVSQAELDAAWDSLDAEFIRTLNMAAENIRHFHEQQVHRDFSLTDRPGIVMGQRYTPIERVGICVPSAPKAFPSTILMNVIPARIAGVREIVVVTPPDKNGHISAEALAAARIAGADRIFKIGGAQAVAALAYGTESIPRVDKIFGPGNRYVTKAKQLVGANDVAVDLPAGPSEVLVLADDEASPAFAAADLLSQAEHGGDSQAVLVCPSVEFARDTQRAVGEQLLQLRRGETIREALRQSRIVVLDSREKMIGFANAYAPEHLIISMRDAWDVAAQITAAGSVFIGPWSPESAGDYASGTNHTLPTGGWARAYSGVNTDSFLRKITYQELSRKGLAALSPTVIAMAEAEGLGAHAAAVRVRMKGGVL